MQVKVEDINTETVRKGKNTYQKINVTYKQGGQQRTYTAMSFSNPGVFAKLAQVKAGDVLEVKPEKNDRGFWEWVDVSKVGGVPVAVPQKQDNSRYETPEERALRQRLIVRQSSLSAAIDLLKTEKNIPSAEEVMKLAEQFCDWVFEVEVEEADKSKLDSSVTGFEDLTDDIPY